MDKHPGFLLGCKHSEFNQKNCQTYRNSFGTITVHEPKLLSMSPKLESQKEARYSDVFF